MSFHDNLIQSFQNFKTVFIDTLQHGHNIVNSSGTTLTSREDMKFSEPFTATDDSTNEVTEIGLRKIAASEIDDIVSPLPSHQIVTNVLNDFADVNITNPQADQFFTYNATSQKWENSNGVSTNQTVAYTSVDDAAIFNSGNLGGQSTYAWTAVSKIATGEKHSSLFNKVSTMFKNIRTIAKLIGTTDISAIGDGTVTGAVSELNSDLNNISKFKAGDVVNIGNVCIASGSGSNGDKLIGQLFLGKPIDAISVTCTTTSISGYTISGVQGNLALNSVGINGSRNIQFIVDLNTSVTANTVASIVIQGLQLTFA